MRIDLFNKTADEQKIASAIVDGTFRFRSKLYAKYCAKSLAEGLIVGTVASFALIGVLATIDNALTPNEDSE